MIDKYLKLWIGSPQGVAPVVRLSQYDTKWRLICTIYDGDSMWAVPSGAEVIINGRKEDGTVFTSAGSVSGGNAIVVIPASATAAAGKVECELSIGDGGAIVGTANFVLEAEKAPMSGHTASSDDFSAVDQLVNQALVAASTAGSAAEAVAAIKGAVSSPLTATSAEGMTNQDKVYVYTGTTTSSLTNGHWYYYDGSGWQDGGVYNAEAINTDTTLSVSGMAPDSEVIGDFIDRTTGNDFIPITKGKYLNCSGDTVDITALLTAASMQCAIIPCEAGDEFTVDTHGGTNGRAFCFIDEDGSVLYVSASSTNFSNWVITAPVNTAYLIAQSYNYPLFVCKKERVGAAHDNFRAAMSKDGFISDDFYVCGAAPVATGVIPAGSTRLATKHLFTKNDFLSVRVLSGYRFYILGYDEDKNYIGYFRQSGGFNLVNSSAQLKAVKYFDFTRYTNVSYFRLLVARDDNGTITYPERVNIIFTKPSFGPDTTLTKENEAAEAQATGYVVNTLGGIIGNRPIVFQKDSYMTTSGSTVNLTKVLYSTAHYNLAVLDASEGDKFTLNGTGGNDARLWAFVDSSGNVLSKAAAGATASNLVLTAPASTAKLIVQVQDGYGICCTGELLTARIDEAISAQKIAPWLHKQPTSMGQFNAIRRMRQHTDLKWSPCQDNKIRQEAILEKLVYPDVAAPRDDTNFFRSDVVYEGIPYSGHDSIVLHGGFVGTECSLDAFVSSANMPLTEFMEKSDSVMNWGSPYYGSVCSNTVAYALGLSRHSPLGFARYNSSDQLVTRLDVTYIHDIIANGVRQNLDDLELVDILWTEEHVAMVTDLIITDGHVTDIEVSEESMVIASKCRRWMYSLDDFYNRFGEFKILRYSAEEMARIDYKPNPYAPMPDEGTRWGATTKFQVLPIYGNRCNRRPNFDNYGAMQFVVRNIADSTHNLNPNGNYIFTHLIIEKNGEAFGDPIEINQSATAYKTAPITLDSDEVHYTAYLGLYINGELTYKSTPCEWIVMPARTPTITLNPNTNVITIEVTFKCPEFSPQAYVTDTSAIQFSTFSKSRHVNPDKCTSVIHEDGSVTYTIVDTYTGSPQYVGIYYESARFGAFREGYSIS